MCDSEEPAKNGALNAKHYIAERCNFQFNETKLKKGVVGYLSCKEYGCGIIWRQRNFIFLSTLKSTNAGAIAMEQIADEIIDRL